MIPHRQGLGSRAVLKGAYALRIANPLSVPGCTQLALASTPARARQSPRLLYANIVARANTWCVRLIFFSNAKMRQEILHALRTLSKSCKRLRRFLGALVVALSPLVAPGGR